ncbi:MarR family winged helix-turn-helix transcriptional regulator [Microlunatus sp. GCM10028923]|uniref:MarR family winged helix-turn-helix transcriptional regulator n=1 Tax=Microlunatus sp. GCM10028923 TaxID=3273400 RepID=UPI0036174469
MPDPQTPPPDLGPRNPAGLERTPTVELLETLGQLIRTARALNHRQTEELGFSGTPFGIVKLLADGDRRPGDLATELQIAPSVVSRALVPLERDGQIERRLDPADARSFRLALTDAGRARLAQRRELIQARIERLLEHWPDDDITTLTRLMRRLENDIQSHADELLQPPAERAEPPPPPPQPSAQAVPA